jgi:hypothetical protein
MPTWRLATSSDDPDAACITAGIQSGNNAPTGSWAYNITGQSGNTTAAPYEWGTVNGQLESGEVDALFVATAGGGNDTLSGGVGNDTLDGGTATWTISDGDELFYNYQGFNTIEQVGFYVEIDNLQTSETIEWTGLTITFYDANDNPAELDVARAQLPQATTGGPLQNFWIAVPDSDFTAVRVVVSGSVQLNASVPTPGLAALVGSIYVWTDMCIAAPSWW